eukprot:13524091-Heterocapsa_arctica.AAC.1
MSRSRAASSRQSRAGTIVSLAARSWRRRNTSRRPAWGTGSLLRSEGRRVPTRGAQWRTQRACRTSEVASRR